MTQHFSIFTANYSVQFSGTEISPPKNTAEEKKLSEKNV